MKDKISDTKKIINLLLSQEGHFVWSYDLEKVNTQWGWIGTSGLRRIREIASFDHEGNPVPLCVNGKSYIIEKDNSQKYVKYRIIPLARQGVLI